MMPALFITDEKTAVSKHMRIFSHIEQAHRHCTNLYQEYLDLYALHGFNAIFYQSSINKMSKSFKANNSTSSNVVEYNFVVRCSTRRPNELQMSIQHRFKLLN